MGKGVEKRDPEVREPDRDLVSTSKHRGFGGNKQPLPLKSVGEIIAEAGEEIPWVVENLLARGALTDFAGQAKKGGKTTFWCHAIAAGAKGEDHAGLHVEPAKYLYLTEQGNNFAGPLEESNLDEHEEYVKVLRFKDVAGANWNELMKRTGEEAERLGLDALIVDTFAVFSGLKGSEENESGPVGHRMRVLRLVAQKHNIAVCLIRHSGKDGKPRGSSAFEAEADICVVLSRPEGNHAPGVRKLEVIGRYGEWERNIEFKDGRYVSLGTDNKIEFAKAVQFIKHVLPTGSDAGLKKTRDSL